MSKISPLAEPIKGLSASQAPFWQRFATGICCVLLMSLHHRFSALGIYADETEFRALYYGYTDYEAFLVFFEQFKPAIINGLRTDVLFSLVAAVLLAASPRWLRIVGLILIAAFYASNLEHIKYNFTSFELSLMGMGADMTFLTAQFTPALVEHFFSILILGLLTLFFFRWQWSRVLAIWLSISVVASAIIPIVPISINHPLWMQTHPLVPSMRSPSIAVNDRVFPGATFDDSLTAELGEIKEQKNLLIVYLEGLSTVSLDKGDMAFMRKLATQNIQFENYLGHQIITSNGLFTTLTGVLPRFIDTDLLWDELTTQSPTARRALPSLLRNAGYQTRFVQSAPLEYMDKDKFLPMLGFDALVGDADFNAWHSKNRWGVDDLTLFENVIDQIDQLDPEKPWMMATLTTGTHAPYNTPADFRSDLPSARYRALNYADAALKYLITELTERGLLENTIVVITSDESREISGNSYLEDEIALNWLPLIIINKDRPAAAIDTYFTSADLPRLIASQLNGTNIADLKSRNDQIAFGNIVSGRFFYFDTQAQELLACETNDFACAIFDDFNSLSEAGSATPSDAAFFPGLKAVVTAHE